MLTFFDALRPDGIRLMKTERRFLVAPSLARLVRREHSSSERIAEGYFPSRPGRTHLVRIEAAHCSLVLISAGSDGVEAENETELPRSQAEALMEVCAGAVGFVRTPVPLESGDEGHLDRLVAPGGLDLLTVAFDSPSESRDFCAPAWFGREVSEELAYENRSIALEGLPRAEEVPLSDAMLDAYLDASESRSRADHQLPQPNSLPMSTSVEPPADPGQGEAAYVAAAAQTRSVQLDRPNGMAAVLARTGRTPNASPQRERLSAPASERLGWRARQSEQQS
jgi:CYTH domain-containing protein